MKYITLILLTSVILLGACATTPTIKSVAGEYKIMETGRLVLLENGVLEAYENDKKEDKECKWKLVDGEILIIDGSGSIGVFSINKDGSITFIAIIRDGKQDDSIKFANITYKKIK